MITIKNAETIANQHMAELQKDTKVSLQITKIQEESFGWVFFYESKEYIDTGYLSSMLAGNAPFIVDNQAGEVHTLGTAHPAEFYIQEYVQQIRGSCDKA